MKKPIRNPFTYSLLLGLILCYATSFAQLDDSRLDSVFYFQHVSAGDSLPESKQVCSYASYENSSDCYNFSTCITSFWNSQSREWEVYSRSSNRSEEDGDKRISVYYLWDKQTATWQQRQRTFDLDIGSIRETNAYDWDTLTNTWIQTNSFRHEFDEAGNQTLFQSKVYNEENEIWLGSKVEKAFDTAGREIEYIGYQCDEEDGSWIANSRQTWEYDAAGNLMERVNYSWEEEEESWRASSLNRFAYDMDGREVLQEKVNIFRYSNPPAVVEKWEKTYDLQGNLVLEVHSKLEVITNDWIVARRTESTFNDLDELILKNTYEWNEQLELLLLTAADSFAYSQTGEEIFARVFYYDVDGSIIGGFRRNREYNAEGRRVLDVIENWQVEEEVWRWSRKTETPFHPNGQRIYYASYNWDAMEEKWIGQSKSGYEYAPSGYIRYFYRALWSLSRDDWGTTSSRIIDRGPCNRERVVPASEGAVLLYPNPVQLSWLYVESELDRPMTFEILDMTGRSILAGEMNALVNRIDLSQFSNGTYLLRIRSGDHEEIQKFMIARP